MYLQHFNLEKKPFQISSDHEFLWLGKKHAVALEILKKGLANKQRIMILTGDVGTGKTTLTNEIIHTLNADTQVAKIVDPCFEMNHIYEFIAQAFGFEASYKKGKKFSSEFFSFLETAHSNGKKILIIVDEAQRIPERFLKEIVSFSEVGLEGVLTVLLAGQLEFLDVLKTTLGPSWKDQIDIHSTLEPLNEEETKAYINKRLEIAGTHRKIFLVSAISECYTYSKGIPRLINISCDQALIQAFAKGMKIVDAVNFKQVVQELSLPAGKSERQEQKKDNPQSENMMKQGSLFITPKKSALLTTTAGICLCFLVLFYLGYTPSALNKMPSDPPDSIKSWKSEVEHIIPPVQYNYNTDDAEQILTKTSAPAAKKIPKPPGKEIGLGYTPALPSETMGNRSPGLTADITKKDPAAETGKDRIKDLDEFIEDVLLVKKQPFWFPEDSIENQKNTSMTPEMSPVSLKEPEPDAIIDWLIEKRNSVKNQ